MVALPRGHVRVVGRCSADIGSARFAMHDVAAISQSTKGTGVKMPNKVEINWLREPEQHDYPAALSYLCLLYDEPIAAAHVDKLKRAPISQFKAKDIFRASGLSLLGISNAHVVKDQQKIQSAGQLSPLLLVRDSANGKIIVAD